MKGFKSLQGMEPIDLLWSRSTLGGVGVVGEKFGLSRRSYYSLIGVLFSWRSWGYLALFVDLSGGVRNL